MLLVVPFGVGLRSRFVAECSRRAYLCIALVGLCGEYDGECARVGCAGGARCTSGQVEKLKVKQATVSCVWPSFANRMLCEDRGGGVVVK